MSKFITTSQGYGENYGTNYGDILYCCVGNLKLYNLLPTNIQNNIFCGYTDVPSLIADIINIDKKMYLYILDININVDILNSYTNITKDFQYAIISNKTYTCNMYNSVPIQSKNIEALRMPRYAIKGDSADISTDIIAGESFAILPYTCKMISCTNSITLDIIPICNNTDISVLLHIEGGNIPRQVPDFRVIKIDDTVYYNTSSITYWC